MENFETDRTCSMSEEVRGRWDSGDERLMLRLRLSEGLSEGLPQSPDIEFFERNVFFIQSLKNLNGK